MLNVETVVTGMDELVVFMSVLWLVGPDVVDMLLEVTMLLELVKGIVLVVVLGTLLEWPVVLELVKGVVVGGTVELPVEGGAVLEVAGVVPFEGTAVFVVASVAGILQSVAGPTPVLGCFVEPGGMINTWPIGSLSQSRPGLICSSDEN